MYHLKLIVLLIFEFIALASANGVLSKIACEWNELKIECSRGELLTIISANYGRTSSSICSYERKTNCYATNSLDIVKSKCNGHSSCTVMAKNDIFGDPCPYTIKYLEVIYSCQAPPCPEIKCNDGKCVSTKSICNGKRDCADGGDEMGCDYSTANRCEHDMLNTKCKKGEIIRIFKC